MPLLGSKMFIMSAAALLETLNWPTDHDQAPHLNSHEGEPGPDQGPDREQGWPQEWSIWESGCQSPFHHQRD